MNQNSIHQIFNNNQNKTIAERKPFLTKYEKEVLKLNSEKKIVCITHLSTNEKSNEIIKSITNCNFQPTDLKNLKEFSNMSIPKALPIQSFHDTKKNEIHLFLSTFLDVSNLMNCSESIENEIENHEFLLIQSLILIFNISHIILIYHPKTTFNLKLLKYFRILQILKQNLSGDISNSLEQSKYSSILKFSSLYSPGKTLPVLGFIFQEGKKEDEKEVEQQIRTIIKKGKFYNLNDNSKREIENIEKVDDDDEKRILKFLKKQNEFFFKQMKSNSKKYQLPNSYLFFHGVYAIEELIAFKFTNEKFIKQMINPNDEFSKLKCQQALKLSKELFLNLIEKNISFQESLENSLKYYSSLSIGSFQEEFEKKLKIDLIDLIQEIKKKSDSLKSDDILNFKFFSKDQEAFNLISNLEIKILKNLNYNHKIGLKENFEIEKFFKNSSKNLNKLNQNFYFGFEYISLKSGLKFLLPPPQTSYSSSSDKRISEQEFLETDLSLIMNVPSFLNLKDEEKVILNQIYLFSSSEDLYSFYPEVTFEQKGDEKVSSYFLKQQIILPKNSFVLIKFNYLLNEDVLRKIRLKLLKNFIQNLK
eukprot:gene9560-1763_t